MKAMAGDSGRKKQTGGKRPKSSIREEAARRAAERRASAREEQADAARARRKARAESGDQPTTRRARFFRRVMRLRPLRRMYARRLMKFMAKSKAKGRPIPDELAQLDEYLSKLPPAQRQAMLEASLSGELEGQASRDMRRAAERQARRSGRGGGRQRPGMPPVPGARPRPR